MYVVRDAEVKVSQEGAASVRVLLTPESGETVLSVTQVDLEPGAATLEHAHDTDQVVYVLAGEAVFAGGGEEWRLGAGDLILVPAGTSHVHRSVGAVTLRQLAIFAPAGRR